MREIVFMLTVISAALLSLTAFGRPLTIEGGRDLSVSYPESSRPVLATAIDMLGNDLKKVFGNDITVSDHRADITIDIDPASVREEQGFRMVFDKDGSLVITSHDSYGAAYGIIELSRLIGVSPWEWWADTKPLKKRKI